MALFQLNTPSNPTSPASYTLISGTPPSCSGDQQICTIEAPVGAGSKPQIDRPLLEEMVTALNTHTNSSNVTLKS
ncbi:hypothetical protein [Sphingobacterium sp. UDSM-2020]|uniref:hypothetical protein n=1 Tax=Sphingobacterium TaxID=28453 RepID=UPI0019352A74|nr:hypothetical protein [Sphingobacterium sp. UDSM-2020]QQD13136.1 hypothetical protein JAZ75_21480 [Sphingobacterium sp. UDSM-2020]